MVSAAAALGQLRETKDALEGALTEERALLAEFQRRTRNMKQRYDEPYSGAMVISIPELKRINQQARVDREDAAVRSLMSGSSSLSRLANGRVAVTLSRTQ